MMRIARASAVVLLVSLAACSRSDAQSPKTQGPSDVVATVGQNRITLAQVDERAMQQSVRDFGTMKLQQAIYEARRAVLEDLINDSLLDQEAQKAGLDRQALVDREVTKKVDQPTEAEIETWYKQNSDRVQNATLEQVRPAIREYLTEERTRPVRVEYLSGLKDKMAVKIALDIPRQKVEAAGRPDRGPAKAPIEIVEFSDFQCPFCLRAHPTVTELLKTYGDRVHFVYRHFPLPNHPNARPAAEAAACANEQGKFWAYHDRLFENQGLLTDADLKKHATALGLDASKFNSCFDTRKFQKDVDDDISAGQGLGVSGTPAFYINGRQIDGAQPLENFKRIIEEELAASKG
jgi:protein-disulfide isomerase